ncbi:uncharacterized protein LOC9656883 [Selaginella moellendorffii]|uniref:uncharacterized protein LOC9656883 n=1 Tax=Selaginella moellendorffii TaxID=88036 RepID=UPI000D1C274C|nr:uncharacterized protein LOC9656883 [Selaginella moellendorffii]|eukprot:XP_024543433.1 uncharacterized protein LOC9656883 [Selaginella moellendorffii]
MELGHTPWKCSAALGHGRLRGLRVAFTAPGSYAPRLEQALDREGAATVSCPTIAVERTPHTQSSVRRAVSALHTYSCIAFTSRSGIASIAHALGEVRLSGCAELVVGALGKDAELIQELDLFKEHREQQRLTVVVPRVATPDALVEELGDGAGRRLLCPVPYACGGLSEPDVVPNFVAALQRHGWDVERLDAYATSWTGSASVTPLLAGAVDALVFTSTAEVEGLLMALHAHHLTIASLWPCVLVAFGPVTARGAKRLGVDVDVVGHRFNSFTDLADLLVSHFRKRLD